MLMSKVGQVPDLPARTGQARGMPHFLFTIVPRADLAEQAMLLMVDSGSEV